MFIKDRHEVLFVFEKSLLFFFFFAMRIAMGIMYAKNTQEFASDHLFV